MIVNSFELDDALHLTPIDSRSVVDACQRADARIWLDLQDVEVGERKDGELEGSERKDGELEGSERKDGERKDGELKAWLDGLVSMDWPSGFCSKHLTVRVFIHSKERSSS